MSFGARSTKIYVGNLPCDIRSNEVESVFKKYGRIKDIDVKNRAESSFAFVEFESSRDAEDAIHGRNNYRYEGHTLKVEMSKGAGSDRGGRRGSGGYRGSYNGRCEDRNTSAGGGGRPRPFGTKSKSTEFRLRISGLPQSASWQDLKDHMKSAGDVSYADVFRDGTGVCDYLNEDDMKYALKTLDDSELKTYRGDVGRIRLERESRTGRRSRSRSRSRSDSPKRHRRSPNYSSKRNDRDTSSSSRSSSN